MSLELLHLLWYKFNVFMFYLYLLLFYLCFLWLMH